MTERDPLADADAVNQVRRAYAAKAARSDRALLITAQLIEIECLLTEATVHTGAVPLDRTTVGELWLAVKDLQRDPDPTIKDLARYLLRAYWRWLA